MTCVDNVMEVDKGENVKFTVADTDTLKEVYIYMSTYPSA